MNNLENVNIKDVITSVVNRTLASVESCCNTPGKFCDTDVWKGNLGAFTKELLKQLGVITEDN